MPRRTRPRWPMRSSGWFGSSSMMHSSVRKSLNCLGSSRMDRRGEYQSEMRLTLPGHSPFSRASSWIRADWPTWTPAANSCSTSARMIRGMLGQKMTAGSFGWAEIMAMDRESHPRNRGRGRVRPARNPRPTRNAAPSPLAPPPGTPERGPAAPGGISYLIAAASGLRASTPPVPAGPALRLGSPPEPPRLEPGRPPPSRRRGRPPLARTDPFPRAPSGAVGCGPRRRGR